jgi:hypothetical protein
MMRVYTWPIRILSKSELDQLITYPGKRGLSFEEALQLAAIVEVGGGDPLGRGLRHVFLQKPLLVSY